MRINGKIWQTILVMLGLGGGFVAAVFWMGSSYQRIEHNAKMLQRIEDRLEMHTEVCSPATINAMNRKIDEIHNTMEALTYYLMNGNIPDGPVVPSHTHEVEID